MVKKEAKERSSKRRRKEKRENQEKSDKPKGISKNGIKLGRPSEKLAQEFNTQSNPYEEATDKVREAWIRYGINIGVKKGFVLDTKVREKLNSKPSRRNIRKVNWHKTHLCNPQKEKMKVQVMVEKFINKYSSITINGREKLCQVLYDLSDIFSEEFTNQVYDFLLSVIGCCVDRTQNYVEDNLPRKFQEYHLILPKFIQIKIKHKFDLVGLEAMKEELKKLFILLIPLMKQILIIQKITFDPQ